MSTCYNRLKNEGNRGLAVKAILFGILAILLMGIAGEMDYQDAKRAEAAAMEEWR